jgi:hypothetical protein
MLSCTAGKKPARPTSYCHRRIVCAHCSLQLCYSLRLSRHLPKPKTYTTNMVPLPGFGEISKYL